MADVIIEAKDVAVGYKTHTVMEKVSFSIKEGELVGIVGCNGAGKSTLLKSLRGILPLQKGEVSFFGVPLQQYRDKEIAQKIAYLQQHVEVGFGFTAEDIVMAGRYPYLNWLQHEDNGDREIVRDCMLCTGTWELRDKPINNVSGGQKQRVLLAKVLAQQTPILFLDEPTTGLDLVYQEEIFTFAKDLSRMGKTILMVVHELDLAYKYCSKILLLGQGTLLADATPQQVFQDELLSKAYGAEIHIIHNEATGNIEVETRSRKKLAEEKKALLSKLCGQSGRDAEVKDHD